MNYIQTARNVLSSKIEVEDSLLDLYTLLVFTLGEKTTLDAVHDAWSIWRTNTKPEHQSIIPFDSLSLSVQELDREYMVAIQETAKEIFSGHK